MWAKRIELKAANLRWDVDVTTDIDPGEVARVTWLIVSYGGVPWRWDDILKEYVADKPFDMFVLAAYVPGSSCDGGNNPSICSWSKKMIFLHLIGFILTYKA